MNDYNPKLLIQAEECEIIIRCHDCTHYHYAEEFGTWCDYWDFGDETFGYINDNDYCSKAEVKGRK